MSRALVSFDTDKIKKYVFATGSLKEIRGGSANIDGLNRHEMFKVIQEVDPGAEKVFADAGSGLFEVEEARAAEVIRRVEELYRQRTVNGSITGAWVGLGEAGEFPDLFKLLALRLRLAKERKGLREVVPAACSFTKTCGSCGREYARHQARGEEEGYLCESCLVKRKVNREQKKALVYWQKGKEAPGWESYWEKILQGLAGEEGAEGEGEVAPYPPETFSDLGKMSEPKNYMALIYADGDGFGQELETLGSVEELRNFSQMVENSLVGALNETIQENLRPAGRELPFNILLLGGDDLLLATAAEKGIGTALGLCEKFAAKTRQQGRPLTLSASVVISHAKYPFSSLLDLAEGSLKFAKDRGARRRRGFSPGYLDQGFINYQVISSGSSRGFARDYQELYTVHPGGNGHGDGRALYRTLKPYTCQELRRLVKLVGQLKDFPRNKLHLLQEIVFMDYEGSILAYLEMVIRMKKAQRLQLHQVLDAFAGPGGGQVVPPWVFSGQETLSTPFLDLVELYRFV